jgi:hypothetical protein
MYRARTLGKLDQRRGATTRVGDVMTEEVVTARLT